MNRAKLKTLSISELTEKLKKVQIELLESRFDLKIGQEKDHSVLKKKRKEVSRIKTLLHGYNLGIYEITKKSDKKSEKLDKKTKSVKDEKQEKKKISEKL